MGVKVILGGSGFIGTHLAQHLLRSSSTTEILLVDIAEPRTAKYASALQDGLRSGRVRYIQHDLRRPIPSSIVEGPVQRIYNLAAVHREPGHKAEEYFETNLLGAETACDLATRTGCNRMVFTSSISPYGPSEEVKNETSIPTPETPYGSSKLAAEKMHLAWQAANPERKLLILRPGVVFGPGEGGNVTRLVRSVVRGYFVYVGNRETRKAAGYVKELCEVFEFGLELLEKEHLNHLLLNFSIDPVPTLQQFVVAIQEVAHIQRPIPSIPRGLLVGASYPIALVSKVIGLKQPIDPVRVRKLFRSTYVQPSELSRLGYRYRFTLKEAFADWQSDLPEDFVG